MSSRREHQHDGMHNPSPTEGEAPVAGSTNDGFPSRIRASFFHGTTSPIITDGQFIGNQQIQLVFNTPSSLDAIGSSERGTQAEANQERSLNVFGGQPSRPRPSLISRFRNWTRTFRRGAELQNQILRRNGSPVERDVFEIYKRHLLPKGYGYPLWIPQSNMRLPVPYRQIGVSIGDVGIITREGAFDFLFNISCPKNHPVNTFAPPDFEPLSINLDSNILEYREFSWGTYLASDDIQVGQGHPNGIHFTTSSPQGAILTMPKGAYVQRLASADHLHDYIGTNAASWYKFVNGQLGRGANNGDIRIVLGCHKSTTWGMATVLNTSQYAQSQTLRFGAFQPYNNYPHQVSYFWEASGSVRFKVGPEPGDNDGLSQSQGQELRNQCLFVRTSAVTLGENSWASLHLNGVPSIGGGIDDFQHHGIVPRTPPNGVPSSIPQNMENRGRQGSVALLSDAPCSDTVDHTKAINTLLLQENPEMQVAITDDNEWCSVLDKDDPNQISSSDLFTRICHQNDIRKTSRGLIYFVLKDQNPKKPPITYTDRDANDFLGSIKQDKRAFKERLLAHLPDFKQLNRTIRMAYFRNSDTNGTIPGEFPPFLMDRSEDLFLLDRLLDSLRSEDPALLPLHLDGKFTKTEAYKQLNSPSFPQAQRRRYFKALGDNAWKQYLQFERLDDLDETIWLYGKVISLTPSFSIQSLVPLFGLCSALFRRFFLKRNLHDLVHLARYARRQDLINLKDLIDLFPSALVTSSAVEQHQGGIKTLLMPLLTVQSIDSEHPSRASSVNVQFPSTFVDLFAQLQNDHIPLPPRHTTTTDLYENSDGLSPMGNKSIDTLNFTQHWIEDTNPHVPILWFYGPSAMSVVSDFIAWLPPLVMQSHVGSIFTFSDKAAWNDEASQLFPAIAVHLAYRIPGLLEQYRKIITDKSSDQLMSASLEIQFWSLIIDPICKLPSKPTRTVIINGIDNCGYETTKTILTLITNALVIFALPLRFIIASNRDPRLQDLFNRPSLSKISRQFFLGLQPTDTNSPNGVKEPAEILRHGFQAIYKQPSTHPGGNKWPSEEAFNLLIERSKKNIIYADTLVNFLATAGEDPNIELQRVLGLTPSSQEIRGGVEDLDCLFIHILSRHHNRNILVHALGILLVLHDCAHPQKILEDLFGMRTDSYDSVLHVLRSLMHFPKVENEYDIHPWRTVKKNVPKKDQRVKSPFLVLALLSLSTMAMPTAFTIPLAFRDRVHDLFYDFLINPERSGPFYVDIAKHHGFLSMAGFACVVKYMIHPLRHDVRLGRQLTISSETWDYLTFHLPDHYSQCSDKVREEIIEQLQDALIAISNGGRENSEWDIAAWTDEFFDNVTVLIDLIINHWDSFGEWSHFTSKHAGKYTEFRRVMAIIREDLFPRQSSMRLRRLSGKFTRTSAIISEQPQRQ